MYTLRIIKEEKFAKDEPFEQITENRILGNWYKVIKKGISREFYERSKDLPEVLAEHAFALILSERQPAFFIFNDKEMLKRTYYIMTESGKTFEKL